MLAQVFNPTETKKNGPATRPPIAPARRVTFLFNAGWVVLAARPKAIATQIPSSIGRSNRCRPEESDEERPRGQPSLFRSHLIRAA